MSASSPWPTEHSPQAHAHPPGPMELPSDIDLAKVLFGHKLVTLLLLMIGLGGGYYLFTQAKPIFSSSARVRVFQPRPMTTGLDGRLTINPAPQLETFAVLITSPTHLEGAVKNLKDGDLLGARGNDMLGYVSSGLVVKESRTGKEFLEFTFDGPHPEDCPIVLNAVVNEFTKYLETSQEGDTKKAIKFIDDAKKLLDKDLHERQLDYNKFKADSKLLFTGEKARNVHQERLLQIESTRSSLLIQEAQLRAELDAIEAAIAQKVSRESLLLMIDTASRQRNDPNSSSPTASLSSQLLPLIFEEEKLLQSLGSEHPRVREVRRKIELTRAMFENREPDEEGGKGKPRADWLDIYVDSLRQGLKKLDQQKKDLDALFGNEQNASRELAEQENKDQAFRDDIDRVSRLFDSVLDQLQTLNLAKDNGTLKAEVVSPPAFGWQVGPAYARYLGGGAIVGWLLALILSFLIEASNRGFMSLEDVTRRLHLPVMGTIPLIEQKPVRRELRSKLVDRMAICHHKPASFASEAYRAVRSALFLGQHGNNLRVLQVTSSEAGAGKSTLAANLAISIAQSGKNCLLIDADCRRPTQHTLFGLNNDVGLTTVLKDAAELPDAIRQSDVPRLDLLTSGKRPSNPAELLMAEGFRNLLEKTRDMYDFVVIDTPPVLAVTDGSIISPNVDGVLFITRLGRNARVLCTRGLERLRMVNANVIGVVLNAVRLEQSEYGLGRYHYGYRYYGAGHEYFKDQPALPPESTATTT